MAWTPPKPAETYETLVKQFRALCSLHACVEAQLRTIQADKHREIQARAQLDGERAANQVLTNEIDRLLAENDALRQRIDVLSVVVAAPIDEGTLANELDVLEAVEAEREACARIADAMCIGDFERDTPGRTEGATRSGIAASIRARASGT